MALRSASPIHFAPVSAAKSSLFLNLRVQGATCEGPDQNRATFYLDNGGLFLYSRDGETQQVFVDRSGMGQGKLGYITGSALPPRNAELTGWTTNEVGDLYFKRAILLACPHSIQDSWSVWVATDNPTPGGNQGCLGAVARTVPNENPMSCEYGQ